MEILVPKKRVKDILVDMDGTTFDIDGPLNKRMKEIFPQFVPLPHEALVDYHLETLYPEEIRPYFEQAWKSPGLFSMCEPIPGALEAIAHLSKIGRVFFCSTPRWDNPTCIADKRELIRKYFGEEYVKRLSLVDDKTGVQGDMLIDDKPKIRGEWKPLWEHILYTRPWNKSVEGKRRLNWQNYREVLEID